MKAQTETAAENAEAPTAIIADDSSETTAEAPGKKMFADVPLMEPIVRGEKTITDLTIRKPKAGELRGLSLSDVIGMDIVTILKLIPRISDPALSDAECQELDPADLTEIGGAIRGFFMTKAERKLMEAMIAEHQPKT